MMRYMLILLAIGIGGGFIIWNMLKFLMTVSNSRSKMDREINEYLDEFVADQQNLVPWEKEELELLSVVPGEIFHNKGLNRRVEGTITNIYEEKVFNFAFKEYFTKKYRAFLVAVSSKHQFVYQLENEVVRVFLNSKSLGKITQDGRFLDHLGKEQMKLEDMDSDLALLPITVKGKKVALISNSNSNDMPTKRALKLLDTEDKIPLREDLVLALTTFEMVKNFSN